MDKAWTPEEQDQIGNALIVAQNALTGYWQLANAPETEEHQQMAQHALDAVREAIRLGGVLEQQGIVPAAQGLQPGDTVRMTDEAYRGLQASGLRNGQVVSIQDGIATVEWLDPALPPQLELSALEKVERKKAPEAWTGRAGGFEVGDRVRYKDSFLRSIQGHEVASMRGEIVEFRGEGKLARAKVRWDGEDEPKGVLLSNLSKAKERGVGE